MANITTCLRSIFPPTSMSSPVATPIGRPAQRGGALVPQRILGADCPCESYGIPSMSVRAQGECTVAGLPQSREAVKSRLARTSLTCRVHLPQLGSSQTLYPTALKGRQ